MDVGWMGWMTMEDELFLAEVANLEAAGQREVELKRLIREKQTEIREAKKQRRQGGTNFSVGRMSKREQNAENMRRDELKRLEEGLLPGEPDRTPAPTTRDLTIGVMRSGLAIYRCLRTSSALEGYLPPSPASVC